MRIGSLVQDIIGNRQSRFTVSLPCDRATIDAYYRILKNRFGDEGIIPSRDFLQCVPDINPYGIIIVRNASGEVLGGIELYGLQEEFFDDYLAGKMTDSDFRPDHILTVPKTIADARLYCAITIADFKTNKAGKQRPDTDRIREIRDYLLIATVHVIKRVYLNKQTKLEALSIYAIGASPEGRGLLENGIRFDRINDGIGRKDECRLYHLIAHSGSLDRVLEAVLAEESQARPGDLGMVWP